MKTKDIVKKREELVYRCLTNEMIRNKSRLQKLQQELKEFDEKEWKE